MPTIKSTVAAATVLFIVGGGRKHAGLSVNYIVIVAGAKGQPTGVLRRHQILDRDGIGIVKNKPGPAADEQLGQLVQVAEAGVAFSLSRFSPH